MSLTRDILARTPLGRAMEYRSASRWGASGSPRLASAMRQRLQQDLRRSVGCCSDRRPPGDGTSPSVPASVLFLLFSVQGGCSSDVSSVTDPSTSIVWTRAHHFPHTLLGCLVGGRRSRAPTDRDARSV